MTRERIYRLDEDELADIREGVAEIERGEVASEAEVRATFDELRRASDGQCPLSPLPLAGEG
jgi:predicted transcriptional regulator